LLAAATGRVEIARTLLVGAKALPEAEWARKNIEEDGNISLAGGGVVERTYLLGWTPLIVACQGGHMEVVRLLLMAGANLEPRSPMGRTALEIAREHG
jgi:Ankyrin repeats (3 copies)